MITKVKTSYPIDLPAARVQLRLDDDFIRDDNYIESLIPVATQAAENRIRKDIAITTNVLKLYNFAGSTIKLNQGNLISITAITTKENPLVPLDNYNVYIYSNRFRIELDDHVTTDELTVTFETGYPQGSVPPTIRQAILIKVADLYDLDRASSVMVAVRPTGVFDALLEPHAESYVNLEEGER